jgi:hypothetical protein
MTKLDHIAVIAPDLASGVAYVQDVLGVAPLPGGAHPRMGTHNHLLRIDRDVFLEVIAVDPDAPRPSHRRWFGLDDEAAVSRNWRMGNRLGAYVACCDDVARTIGDRADMFGAPERLTRGDLSWTFGVRADGEVPLAGALPYLMDWGERGTPAPSMRDFGLRLLEVVVESPHHAGVEQILDAIGMFGRRPRVKLAENTRLSAIIETPRGVRTLM